MRSRLANTMRLLFVTLIMAIGLFYISAFTTAAYRSWQVAKLIGCLREIHPGQTTETQARLLFKPFASYETQNSGNGDNAAQAAYYSFYNLPAWQGKLLSILPYSWGGHLALLPGTMFSASLHYRDGLLSEVRVIEMQQERPGFVHPVGASVDIRSTRIESMNDDHDDNVGFAIHHQNTQAYNDKGQKVGSSCCEEEFTTLDERASPQQRSQALNFQPACLILSCKSIRKIRPPL